MEFVIKVYLKTGYMSNEIRQLEELRKYSAVPVPEVYGCQWGDVNNKEDLFFMESMPGVPVRYVAYDNPTDREKIVNAVVDAHIALHNIMSIDGFRELDSNTFYDKWEPLYRKHIDEYYSFICSMNDCPISNIARELIDVAYYNFDIIFFDPVKEARLIHGDFKMKNVLIDPDTLRLTAILDPMDCCYGDREADLFQYTIPHKDSRFGFLDNYTSKVRLSDMFTIKNKYYFLWNELKHFKLMGYCFNDVFEQLGQNIRDMLKYGW
ncbi:MAG: phosphotransferase [Eubacteriales bacterium]